MLRELQLACYRCDVGRKRIELRACRHHAGAQGRTGFFEQVNILLQERGDTTEDIAAAYQALQPIPVTLVRQRQAMRDGLPLRVRTAAARILGERGINPQGRELDTRRLGRTNLIVMIAAIDNEVNALVGMGPNQRHEFSRAMLGQIDQGFDDIDAAAIRRVFDGN